MEREQTLQLAKQAGLVDWTEDGNWSAVDCDLVRFAELVAAHERNTLAAWMIQFGFATGHGDTMEELCDALGTEIVDRIEFETDAAIRNRSNNDH
jgi:hypothetical protein